MFHMKQFMDNGLCCNIVRILFHMKRCLPLAQLFHMKQNNKLQTERNIMFHMKQSRKQKERTWFHVKQKQSTIISTRRGYVSCETNILSTNRGQVCGQMKRYPHTYPHYPQMCVDNNLYLVGNIRNQQYKGFTIKNNPQSESGAMKKPHVGQREAFGIIRQSVNWFCELHLFRTFDAEKIHSSRNGFAG